MRCQIAANGRESLTQFFPVAPVPSVSEIAEPLRAMRLRYRGPRPDHFPALAAPVARGTYLIQPARGWGKVIRLRKRTLPSRFPRAVDVEDRPAPTCSIRQTPSLLVRSEWTAQQVIEKERA